MCIGICQDLILVNIVSRIFMEILFVYLNSKGNTCLLIFGPRGVIRVLLRLIMPRRSVERFTVSMGFDLVGYTC